MLSAGPSWWSMRWGAKEAKQTATVLVTPEHSVIRNLNRHEKYGGARRLGAGSLTRRAYHYEQLSLSANPS